MLLLVTRYTREDLKANPTALFVFGDNYLGVGYGGQAFSARGEPNAVGVITKYSPSQYLTDELAEKHDLTYHYQTVYSHLATYTGVVVYPTYIS